MRPINKDVTGTSTPATATVRFARSRECETRFVRHHGGSKWVPITVSGAATANLSAERENERARLELERRVSQRLEAVGQLSAGIAHEINTPLQFVGDSVAFLQEAVGELLALTRMYNKLLHTTEMIDKEERQRRAVAAERQADLEYLTERIPMAFTRTVDGIGRVRSIVQAMRRFSHASTSDTSPSDLNEALETTLAVCRNEYKYVADVELDLGELPLVTCNVGEINQVLLNLIINAAQAISEKVAGHGTPGKIMISTGIDGERSGHRRSPTTGPGSRASSRTGSTSRSSRPRRSAKAAGRGWRSRARR